MKLIRITRTKDCESKSFDIRLLKIFDREIFKLCYNYSIYSSEDINGHFSISLDGTIYFALGILTHHFRVEIFGHAIPEKVNKFFEKDIDVLLDL